MFDDNDEDYNLYPINNKKYQPFSDKNLLPFCEYLKSIKPKLIKLISDCCRVKCNINVVFRLERFKKSIDKINIYIKSKNTTDIDEIFSQLIGKHEKLSESLKDIQFISEGIESMTYNFTVINTFIESPEWIKNKKSTVNPQNNDNKCFQYSVALFLYHKEIKHHQKEY